MFLGQKFTAIVNLSLTVNHPNIKMIPVAMILTFSVLCSNVYARGDINSEYSSMGIDQNESGLNSLLNGFSNLKSMVTFLKRQIRESVIDIIFEIIKFLKGFLHSYKVKLFKRLGRYTLSDVFRFMFDGIFEFVRDSNTTEIEEEKEITQDMANSELIDTFPDPYFLEKLLMAGGK